MEKEDTKMRKSHVNFGTASSTKVGFSMFSLFAFESYITIIKHRTNLNTDFTEQAMNRFHDFNEMNDGTLNEVHHFLYPTDINSNKCFTFKQAMKEEDKLYFIDAM